MAGLQGFQLELAEGVNQLVQTTDAGIADVVRVMGALSDGDLSQSIQKDYHGSFGELKNYTNNTVQKLTQVIEGQKQVVQAANQGDFTAQIDLNGLKGFQAELGQGLNQLINTTGSGINDVVRVMGALSLGDLSKSIDKTYYGSFADLKAYTNNTVIKLRLVIEGQQNVVQAANQGDFSALVDLSGLTGFQKEMGQGLNQLVATTGEGIADAVQVMGALSNGDLSKTITKQYQGSFAELQKYTNHTVAILRQVIDGQKQVVQAANQGNFKTRIDVAGLRGFQLELGNGLNELVTTTDTGIEEVGRVLQALSSGDLTQKVEREFAGSFDQLKNHCNSTVYKLSEVISEVSNACGSLTSRCRSNG